MTWKYNTACAGLTSYRKIPGTSAGLLLIQIHSLGGSLYSGEVITGGAFFFLYQHLHIKPKNLQSPGILIYVVIYLGTKKYTYKISKKIQPKNNRKIKIIKKNQRKKTNKNLNFKCNINVKAMTSGVHQKSSALNLLVSIK